MLTDVDMDAIFAEYLDFHASCNSIPKFPDGSEN
jgi:hypothetical protein